MEDVGPWFVRVAENKVSVGIFTCDEIELAALIDEICDPGACEYRKLPPGGFVFGGEVVLHELDPEDDNFGEHLSDCCLTEAWIDPVYDDKGPWMPVYVDPED